MSLNSVVNKLVRAAASVPQDISDTDLDAHVARLLASEAKANDAKWAELGLGAYLNSGGGRDSPDPSLPKPNKRFLASVIRTVDGHNQALLRQQAQAASDARDVRAESSRRGASSGASRLFGGALASMGRDSRRTPARDRRERKRERERERGTSGWGSDLTREDRRDRRSRSPSTERSVDDRARDRRRDRRDEGDRRRKYDSEDDRRRRYDSEDDRRRRYDSEDDRRRRYDSEDDDRKRSRHRESDDKRRRRHDLDDERRKDRDREDSRRSKRRVRSEDEDERDHEPDRKRRDRSRERSREPRDKDRETERNRRRHDHRDKRRDSRSPSRSRSPPPPPPDSPPPPPSPPDRISRMDKYFHKGYDPRLDVGEVPKTGVVTDVGWDSMLSILKDRGKKRRRNSPTLSSSPEPEKRDRVLSRPIVPSVPTVSSASADTKTLMEMEYTRKGGVREWDKGK